MLRIIAPGLALLYRYYPLSLDNILRSVLLLLLQLFLFPFFILFSFGLHGGIFELTSNRKGIHCHVQILTDTLFKKIHSLLHQLLYEMVEGNNEKHFVGLLTALEKYQETNLIFRIVLSIRNTVCIKNEKAYYYNS